MSSSSQTIFTLNARGNVMLEVMRDYFDLDSKVMRREIQMMHSATLDVLQSKGVDYSRLKPGLVPSTDRNEAAFLFDSDCIDSTWYGFEVAKAMLPLHDERSTHSILCGDLVGNDQEFIFNMLEESLVLIRPFTFSHGSSLYCVYVNNMSAAALENYHHSLRSFPAYVGYIPTTFLSRAKIYLSSVLVNSYLLHRNVVLLPHEDDIPNSENRNLIGYPFDEYNYEIVSLQASLYDLFLSYKIERPVYPGFDIDTEMSLNAVTNHVLPIDEFTVELADEKYAYLKSAKLGKLKQAGIATLSREELSELVNRQIDGSYIYNLSYNAAHDVVKFAVILEISRDVKSDPTRVLVVLEYNSAVKSLRVITLY